MKLDKKYIQHFKQSWIIEWDREIYWEYRWVNGSVKAKIRTLLKIPNIFFFMVLCYAPCKFSFNILLPDFVNDDIPREANFIKRVMIWALALLFIIPFIVFCATMGIASVVCMFLFWGSIFYFPYIILFPTNPLSL